MSLLRASLMLPGLLRLSLPAVEPDSARPPQSSGVIVLANAADADSLAIARHYAAAREVPAANLLAWKMPSSEAVSWRDFVAAVWNPLLERLVADRWVDAIPMTARDAVGRRKHAPNGHRIAALVVCRGVPLKIEHDPALHVDTPPYAGRGEFRTNAGAVDAELSLLAAPNYPINAVVPNPLFRNETPSVSDLRQVVRVSRLDGPSAADAIGLIDRAIAAEKSGLRGRAYVDIANRDATGDAWFESVARQLEELGFDTAVDRLPGTFPAHARFDAPVLYFGWYASTVDGPFTVPGFRFPPGAIALHLHSYSAATLRSPETGWTGPFIARGVTATVGNVHEPYLGFTHAPHLLLQALARGSTWVEAVYFALPALSWQAVAIGDPLYRPFPPGHGIRAKFSGEAPERLDAYDGLRRMKRLEAEGKPAEALEFALAQHRRSPGLVLGLALARRQLERGNPAAAAATLDLIRPSEPPAVEEWALFREAAALLQDAGTGGAAMEWWRRLLALPALVPTLRVPWLEEAIRTARSEGATSEAAKWQAELARLAPARPASR